MHKNHGKVLETRGFRLGPGVSPDTNYPQGGWEAKQTFAVKGLLVQSRGVLTEDLTRWAVGIEVLILRTAT